MGRGRRGRHEPSATARTHPASGEPSGVGRGAPGPARARAPGRVVSRRASAPAGHGRTSPSAGGRAAASRRPTASARGVLSSTSPRSRARTCAYPTARAAVRPIRGRRARATSVDQPRAPTSGRPAPRCARPGPRGRSRARSAPSAARTPCSGRRGAVGAPGELDDLQGPDEAPGVGPADRARPRRGPPREVVVQRARDPRRRARASSRARTSGSVGCIVHAVEQRAHVQPRPPTTTRAPPAASIAARSARACALVRRDRGVLLHLEHVELVVGHAPALGGGELGGADVHPAVELHRVGVDHLAAERQRERERRARTCRWRSDRRPRPLMRRPARRRAARRAPGGHEARSPRRGDEVRAAAVRHQGRPRHLERTRTRAGRGHRERTRSPGRPGPRSPSQRDHAASTGSPRGPRCQRRVRRRAGRCRPTSSSADPSTPARSVAASPTRSGVRASTGARPNRATVVGPASPRGGAAQTPTARDASTTSAPSAGARRRRAARRQTQRSAPCRQHRSRGAASAAGAPGVGTVSRDDARPRPSGRAASSRATAAGPRRARPRAPGGRPAAPGTSSTVGGTRAAATSTRHDGSAACAAHRRPHVACARSRGRRLPWATDGLVLRATPDVTAGRDAPTPPAGAAALPPSGCAAWLREQGLRLLRRQRRGRRRPVARPAVLLLPLGERPARSSRSAVSGTGSSHRAAHGGARDLQHLERRADLARRPTSRVRDDGSVHAICEVATDLGRGVTDDQLGHLLRCGLATGRCVLRRAGPALPRPGGAGAVSADDASPPRSPRAGRTPLDRDRI